MDSFQENVFSVISDLYFSSDSKKRLLSYQFLGELGRRVPVFRLSILKLLMKSLVDKEIENQLHGIYYLGELGRYTTDLAKHVIYPLILVMVSPKSKEVHKFFALNALEKINKNSSEVERFLSMGISDIAYMDVHRLYLNEPDARSAGIWELGKLGIICFPAIIDFIPLIIRRIADEDKSVSRMARGVVLNFFKRNPYEMLEILFYVIENSDNIPHKLKIYDIFEQVGRQHPYLIDEILPNIIRELENPNRIVHLKIYKILRTFERIRPSIFIQYKVLLINALKSKSRYAYHWAVKTFASTHLNYLRHIAEEDVEQFIRETLEIIKLIIDDKNMHLMKTRVILMMMVHEAKEIISLFSGLPKPLIDGMTESLTQIQKSSVLTETEVVAAYEKFEQILMNFKLFLNNIDQKPSE
ncbi:MAG: hypothetical protein ACTSWN_16825 [Promethearchaeota archaeon]